MTADRATLADLALRLEGGETGAKILVEAARALVPASKDEDENGWWWTFHRLLMAGAWLDAAAALVERALPGWDWCLSSGGDAQLVDLTRLPARYWTARVPGKPAAALMLALVRALMARGDAG